MKRLKIIAIVALLTAAFGIPAQAGHGSFI